MEPVVVLVEISESGKICVNQRVCGSIANKVIVDWVLAGEITVVLEDHHAVGEASQAKEEHDGEDLDVHHDFLNHANEGAERLVDSKPVEELDVKQNYGDRTKDVVGLWRDGTRKVEVDEEAARQQGCDVKDVPEASEVANWVIAQLEDLEHSKRNEVLAEENQAHHLEEVLPRQRVSCFKGSEPCYVRHK